MSDNLSDFIDSLNHTVWQLWYGNLSPNDLLAYLVTVKLEDLKQDANTMKKTLDDLRIARYEIFEFGLTEQLLPSIEERIRKAEEMQAEVDRKIRIVKEICIDLYTHYFLN